MIGRRMVLACNCTDFKLIIRKACGIVVAVIIPKKKNKKKAISCPRGAPRIAEESIMIFRIANLKQYLFRVSPRIERFFRYHTA